MVACRGQLEGRVTVMAFGIDIKICRFLTFGQDGEGLQGFQASASRASIHPQGEKLAQTLGKKNGRARVSSFFSTQCSILRL